MDYKSIDVKIIVRKNDPANLRLYEAFYIRKYKPTLNSRMYWIRRPYMLMFYFIDPLFDCLGTLHFISTAFTHFTLHFLCIYIAPAEYFLSPDDAVDRQKLGFEFLL